MNPNALKYIQNLYKESKEWYKNAESKAQILLGAAGAISAYISANTLSQPMIEESITNSTTMTKIFLVLMILSLIASIVFSLLCLRSHHKREDIKDTWERKSKINSDKIFKAERLHFFGDISKISQLEKEGKFFKSLKEIDVEDEIDALSFGIYNLSRNVYNKHTYINMGFISIGLSFIFFLAAAISNFV